MMNNEKVYEGIVIKSVPYSENDAIITILTINGVVSFKARGALKTTSKFMSGCLLYAHSEFTLEEKASYNYLTKVKLIKSNYKIYQNLEYTTCLGLLSETINYFLDKSFSNVIYDSFYSLFEAIDKEFDIYTVTLICLAKITLESGYGLNVNECVRCHNKKSIVSLSFIDGGFICSKCFNNQDEKKSTVYLKTARYIFNVEKENYLHYELDKKTVIILLKELMEYLKESFGYKNLKFYQLFDEIVEI